MKSTIPTVLLVLSTTISQAQLINGNFEDGLNGWTYVPFDQYVEQYSLSGDVPPGSTGSSLSIPAGYDFYGPGVSRVYQSIGSYDLGTVFNVGGWFKFSLNGVFGPVVAGLGRCNDTGILYLYEPWITVGGLLSPWSHRDTLVVIQDPPAAGESICLVLGGGEAYSQWSYAYFDDLFVQVDPSTRVSDMTLANEPSFRPNPATDKLWIDLSEAALSIIAIDASGRTHDLKSYTHRERTLEVDINSLPSGVNLLRVTTHTGTSHLRFLKL